MGGLSFSPSMEMVAEAIRERVSEAAAAAVRPFA
jgi:hypothetical protein